MYCYVCILYVSMYVKIIIIKKGGWRAIPKGGRGWGGEKNEPAQDIDNVYESEILCMYSTFREMERSVDGIKRWKSSL